MEEIPNLDIIFKFLTKINLWKRSTSSKTNTIVTLDIQVLEVKMHSNWFFSKMHVSISAELLES